MVCGVTFCAKAGVLARSRTKSKTREITTALIKAENLMSIISLDYFGNDVKPPLASLAPGGFVKNYKVK
jgi:hypothetical protein